MSLYNARVKVVAGYDIENDEDHGIHIVLYGKGYTFSTEARNEIFLSYEEAEVVNHWLTKFLKTHAPTNAKAFDAPVKEVEEEVES